MGSILIPRSMLLEKRDCKTTDVLTEGASLLLMGMQSCQSRSVSTGGVGVSMPFVDLVREVLGHGGKLESLVAPWWVWVSLRW